MGRRKLPTALKLARGTLEKSRESGDDEPQSIPITEIPDPPELLGKVGREKWVIVSQQLQEANCLQEIDLGIFELYCMAWDFYTQARQLVKEEGIVLEGKNNWYKNPACQVMNDAFNMIQKISVQFGMTPSSRSGMRVPKREKPAEGKDKFFT